MEQFKNQRGIVIISFIFTLANFLLFKWYAELPLHTTLINCLITFSLNYLFWTALSINSYVLKFLLILLSATSITLIYNCYVYNISPLVNQEQLISLKEYYALETSTVTAIPYLFKRSNQRTFINKNESGFVSVLKHLGFKTYYLSLQTDIKKELYQLAIEHDYYALGTKMRSLAKREQFYDEDLLIPLKKIIQSKKIN